MFEAHAFVNLYKSPNKNKQIEHNKELFLERSFLTKKHHTADSNSEIIFMK